MLFLKSLLFIVWNIALGLPLVYFLQWFLFNAKARYIFGKRCFLTPGLIVRKREWLFSKVRYLLHDYLRQAEDQHLAEGYLKDWECRIQEFLWEKSDFIESWRFMPTKLKQSIRTKLVDAVAAMASKLLRNTVPRLLEQWRVEHRIDDCDFQFSVEFFRKYYNQYVHRYLVYFILVINTVIGIANMILYLFIG